MISDKKFINHGLDRNQPQTTFNQKRVAAKDLAGITDEMGWLARTGAAEDNDPLPAGTLVEFTTPQQVTRHGKVAGKAASDYIVETEPGESYLVPPGKLRRIDVVAVAKGQVTEALLPRLEVQEEFGRGELHCARVAFRERRPSDREIQLWASSHFPDLRLVDAVDLRDRALELRFEVTAAEEAVTCPRCQGKKLDPTGLGAKCTRCMGTGSVLKKHPQAGEPNPPMPKASAAPTEPQGGDQQTRGEPLSSEEIEGTGVTAAREFALSDVAKRTEFSFEEVLPRQAQLGQPGAAEAYQDLDRAARWVLSRFNDSNEKYYAVPQKAEMAGDGDARVVRLGFILNARGANEQLADVYITRQGALTTEGGKDTAPARGFVQVDAKGNLPMIMLEGPGGTRSAQEFGFNLSAQVEAAKVAAYSDYATAVLREMNDNPELKQYVEQQLEGATEPAQQTDQLVRKMLTDDNVRRTFEKYIGELPESPAPAVPMGRTTPPIGPLKPWNMQAVEQVSAQPTGPIQREADLGNGVKQIVQSRHAQIDACHATADEVLNTHGGYTADAQADFDARLTKLAVDDPTKKYWTSYFKQYGEQFTRSIPRRSHAKKAEVDAVAREYWTNYYADGKFGARWYGEALTKEIPRRKTDGSMEKQAIIAIPTGWDQFRNGLFTKLSDGSSIQVHVDPERKHIASWLTKPDGTETRIAAANWNDSNREVVTDKIIYDAAMWAIDRDPSRVPNPTLFSITQTQMAHAACVDHGVKPTPEIVNRAARFVAGFNANLYGIADMFTKEAWGFFQRRPRPQMQPLQPDSFRDIGQLAKDVLEQAKVDPHARLALNALVHNYLGKNPAIEDKAREQVEQIRKQKNLGQVDLTQAVYSYVLAHALRDSPRAFKQFKKMVHSWETNWDKENRWKQIDQEHQQHRTRGRPQPKPQPEAPAAEEVSEPTIPEEGGPRPDDDEDSPWAVDTGAEKRFDPRSVPMKAPQRGGPSVQQAPAPAPQQSAPATEEPTAPTAPVVPANNWLTSTMPSAAQPRVFNHPPPPAAKPAQQPPAQAKPVAPPVAPPMPPQGKQVQPTAPAGVSNPKKQGPGKPQPAPDATPAVSPESARAKIQQMLGVPSARKPNKAPEADDEAPVVEQKRPYPPGTDAPVIAPEKKTYQPKPEERAAIDQVVDAEMPLKQRVKRLLSMVPFPYRPLTEQEEREKEVGKEQSDRERHYRWMGMTLADIMRVDPSYAYNILLQTHPEMSRELVQLLQELGYRLDKPPKSTTTRQLRKERDEAAEGVKELKRREKERFPSKSRLEQDMDRSKRLEQLGIDPQTEQPVQVPIQQWRIPDGQFKGMTIGEAMKKGDRKALENALVSQHPDQFLAFVKAVAPDRVEDVQKRIDRFNKQRGESTAPADLHKGPDKSPVNAASWVFPSGKYVGRTIPEVIDLARDTAAPHRITNVDFVRDIVKDLIANHPKALGGYLDLLSPDRLEEFLKLFGGIIDEAIANKQKAPAKPAPTQPTDKAPVKQEVAQPASKPAPAPAPKPAPTTPAQKPDVSPEQFYDMLEDHDWTYNYSDDGAVFRRGDEYQKRLEQIAKSDPEYQKLFDEYQAWAWNKYPGIAKPPKPGATPSAAEEPPAAAPSDAQPETAEEPRRPGPDTTLAADPGVQATPLKKFYQMLDNHDWWWDDAPDAEVAQKGHESQRRLEQIAKESPQHQKLYEDFQSWAQHGEMKPRKPNAPRQEKVSAMQKSAADLQVQQPRNMNKFEVNRFYSTSSSQDAGYVYFDLSWDPKQFEGMSEQNVHHQIVSFIKGLESDKYHHDFGVMGKPHVVEFDVDAGAARVKVRCSNTRGVTTLSYQTDPDDADFQGSLHSLR